MRCKLNASSFYLCVSLILISTYSTGVKASDASESLINPSSYRAIAADRRAYRVGDVLTVNVLEAVSARSGASTDASGKLGVQAAASTNNYQGSADLGLSAVNRGGAETSRIGEFRTHLSVRVTDIEPSGLLWVEGMQALLINGEEQQIILSGSVRPDDINADNTVWSHRLANAKVELSGNGVVSQSQTQSIIYRALKWLRLL